jgi:hypothetical protein
MALATPGRLDYAHRYSGQSAMQVKAMGPIGPIRPSLSVCVSFSQQCQSHVTVCLANEKSKEDYLDGKAQPKAAA